jgi:hypothetical protein
MLPTPFLAMTSLQAWFFAACQYLKDFWISGIGVGETRFIQERQEKSKSKEREGMRRISIKRLLSEALHDGNRLYPHRQLQEKRRTWNCCPKPRPLPFHITMTIKKE